MKRKKLKQAECFSLNFPNKVNSKTFLKFLDKKVQFIESNTENIQGVESGSSLLIPIQRKNAILSYQQLKNLYLNTPKIRECVDGIARRIATSTYSLIPLPSLSITKSQYTLYVSKFQKFFSKLNDKQDNWYTFLLKVAKDLLIYDVCFIEKVRDENGQVVELYVREPFNFFMKKDKHGQILEYIQISGGNIISFNPSDLIVIVLTPSSFEDWGHPLLEVILNEVTKLFYMYDEILNVIIENQSIPGALLSLGQIGEEAFQRLREEYMNNPSGLKIVRGLDADDIKYIPLGDGVPKNTGDFIELIEKIEEIIYTTFQIQHLERIRVGEVAKLQASYLKSNLIQPILEVISQALTIHLVQSELDLPFQLKLILPVFNSSEFYDLSRSVTQLVNAGVISLNEARFICGLPFDPDLNFTYIKLGNEILYVEDETPQRLEDFKEEETS
ncbi:MAG: phage portal protein [Thermoplasmata archaeon]